MVKATYLGSVLLAVGMSIAWGQEINNYRAVTLEQAAERLAPDYRPKLLGEMVRVQGVVQSTMLDAPDATYLPVSNPQRTAGLLLVYSGDNATRKPSPLEVTPGTVIEVAGTVSLHAGQAVVKPLEFKVVGKQELGAVRKLTPVEASSLNLVGLMVELEGEVERFEEGQWGDLLDFKEGGKAIQVFLPLPKRSLERPLSGYKKGDKIRVKGVVTQFCLRPPYNQFFQLMVGSARDITLLEPPPAMPPQIVPATVLLVLICILTVWYNQQQHRGNQKATQKLLEAVEGLAGLGTAREVTEALRGYLSEATQATGVTVFRFDPNRKVLERMPDQISSVQHTFHVEECATPYELNAAHCALRREVVSTRIQPAPGEQEQRLVAIPMMRQGEARGVIVMTGKKNKPLLAEGLKAALQHLSNAAALHYGWIEETALREQQHRSEKLAVAGQLIHGVITELNTPLEKIRDLTAVLPEKDAAAIHAQVQQASEIVKRIVAVARAEQFDARPVDLRMLFQRLMEEMDEDLRADEIESEFNLGPESIYVLGSQEQLLRVFENLLRQARAASTYSLERVFIVNLNRIGRSAMIELEFSGPFGDGEGPDFSNGALSFAITRGLVQSYGGEVKFATVRAGRYRYDVELPSLSASPSEELDSALAFSPQRGMITALLVEPDPLWQRKMLSIFGEMNHRLIPVGNVEEAADLAEKVRFDLVLASSNPEGGTWPELFHRIHHRTPHFVLISESADAQSEEILEGTASSVLKKPIEEAEVIALLERFANK
jgi:signal transduction histidine kinase/CheY-like chemotaxis protein